MGGGGCRRARGRVNWRSGCANVLFLDFNACTGVREGVVTSLCICCVISRRSALGGGWDYCVEYYQPIVNFFFCCWLLLLGYNNTKK